MLALIAALIVSGLFTFWLSRKMTKSHAAAPVHNRYAAAAHALNAGQVLKREDVSLIDWPKSVPLQGAFMKPEDLVGRAVLYPVAAGEPLLDRQLTAAGSGTGLAGKIPEGMRAIALKSDEVVGVAGLLLPGTHVDVLVTFRDNVGPGPLTATVLQDVEVLAIGQQYEPDPSTKPKSIDVVTLLLKPEDAEKAVLASSQGTIHFVLRNGADREQASAPPATLSQLTTGQPVKAPVARRPAQPVQKAWTVETLFGKKSQTDTFN
ncbi:MAG TPA: Flp pilus assembly protein CpaB [Edaphobacter sp.]|nr:Flp pilus assembly protein CpaB [Edaphobacter sp.]